VLFQYSSRLHSANLVNLLGLFVDQDPCRAPKDPGKDSFPCWSRSPIESSLSSCECVYGRSRSGLRSTSGLRASPLQASTIWLPSDPREGDESRLAASWMLLDRRTGMPAGVFADAWARYRTAARAAHQSLRALCGLIPRIAASFHAIRLVPILLYADFMPQSYIKTLHTGNKIGG
jgi:hypothetical protein